MDRIQEVFKNINGYKLLIGLLTLLTTFGFKYIYSDLDDYIEEILDCAVMRKLYIFAFVFMATKDWKVSLLIMIMYSLFVWCCVKEGNKVTIKNGKK